MPWLPRSNFMDWPEDAADLDTSKVIELYENGFAGAKKDQAAEDEFKATMAFPDGTTAAHQFGLAETGKGKLVIPFVFVEKLFPGCWPGKRGQAVGDCVSWGTRNAALTTMCCDIESGQPDAKTGKVEGVPDVPADGIADGVLSTEAIYWWRGYNGHGWMCHAAATVVTSKSGCWVRKDYPELGFDLTNYAGRNTTLYGSKKPGEAILAEGQKHLVHQATELNSFEEIRDFLFNGYGVSSCGGEGYSSKRDENGVSKRSGSWAHAMAYVGVDDRDEIKEIYGEPLVLILNSWAIWNGGPRKILGTNFEIPNGAFWTPWSHCKNREAIAFSGVNGFPRKHLPDYGTTVWG